MKNQYFGDIRDYLKYDLLQETIEKIAGINRLSYIPMLTRKDNRNDGSKEINGMGEKRPELYRFLSNCRQNQQLDIVNLRRYFNGREYEYCPYKDQEYFENYNRARYFEGIPGHYLESAVVFLDPDNGLEPPKTPSNKHVLFKEVEQLLSRMDKNSLLLIYQHKTRQTWDELLLQTVKQLHGLAIKVQRALMMIDSDVSFIGIGKDTNRLDELSSVWFDYASKQGLRYLDSNLM